MWLSDTNNITGYEQVLTGAHSMSMKLAPPAT